MAGGNNSETNENHQKAAQTLIEEGDECVKASKFNDAIEKYNEAIKLNRDPLYFCCRAAAYCRLEEYDLALQDCRSALEIDDKCAKAYGRMGLVFYHQNRYDASLEAHETALALDPFYMLDENYKSHLDVIKEKVGEAQNFCATLFGGTGEVSDFSDFMNNEYVMQAAMQMMKDPNMQNRLESMMEQFMGGSAAAGESFGELFAAGKNMAQQMQQANLELLEQLRDRFASTSVFEEGHQQIEDSSSAENSQHSE
uniref:Uncharacterized protein n=1 Tax=Panagrolaimus superbus TaxID=310955 RepID=A0A914Y874_9BILA